MSSDTADVFCLDQTNSGKGNVAVSVTTTVTDYRYIWIKTAKLGEQWDHPEVVCPDGPFVLGQQMHNDPPAIGASSAVKVRVVAVELAEAMGGQGNGARLVGYRMPFGSTLQNALDWSKSEIGSLWLGNADAFQLFAVRADY